MDNKINLVFNINEAYIKYLLVTLKSINQHTKCNCCVHILHSDLNESDELFIRKMMHEFEFVFHKVSVHEFSAMPNMPQHISIQTVFRLLIPTVIPSEIKKVIYLDADLIVLEDLKELYEIDISDKILAATRMFDYFPETRSTLDLVRMCAPGNVGLEKYFNSGVMLLNLDKMRAEHFVEKSLDLLNEYKDVLMYPDEQVLNILASEDYKALPLKWNTLSWVFELAEIKTSALLEAKLNPSILHYCGLFKPWNLLSNNHIDNKYFSFTDGNTLFNKEIFESRKNELLSKNIFLFGASLAGKQARDIIKDSNIDIKGYFDNNNNLFGTNIDGIPVYDINNYVFDNDDIIIISSYYTQEISRQLEDMGFVHNKNYYKTINIIS